MTRTPLQVVVMGVSGTGKSTVGHRVAALLHTDLFEGDDYHPPENITKMSSGTPLTDEDRLPWLQTLARIMEDRRAAGFTTVLTCSALRRKYRDILRGTGSVDGTLFIHLRGDFELLRSRMASREHFMPASLLRSQFDTLEELEPDECGLVVDVAEPIDEVVADVREHLERTGWDLSEEAERGTG